MHDGGVKVDSVAGGSPAEVAGIRSGDRILAVSGEKVSDLLDLHFLTSRKKFILRWRGTDGTIREGTFRSVKGELGVFPEPIRVRRCKNRCIFCFIHQLPKGLRQNLYIKDEDVRLSFLHGQYVTFSDVTEAEIHKILRYRLSPLYVSIHTTDPDLRNKMLGNPYARDVVSVMKRLIRGGIALHGQIVVCPGINDGEELERTLRSLLPLRPGLSTVSVVPVGLTAHREGLPKLHPVREGEARRTLAMLKRIRRSAGRGGEPFAVAADEYYLIAKEKIPGTNSYGSFAQIENGVGILRRFLDEAKSLFRRRRWKRAGAESGGAVVTGISSRRYVEEFLGEFSRRSGTAFLPLPVKNRFLGKSVTVTGLLGGRDILAAVTARRIERIYLPSVTLRDAGDLFLDGLSRRDLETESGSRVQVFPASPRGFFESVYNGETPLI